MSAGVTGSTTVALLLMTYGMAGEAAGRNMLRPGRTDLGVGAHRDRLPGGKQRQVQARQQRTHGVGPVGGSGRQPGDRPVPEVGAPAASRGTVEKAVISSPGPQARPVYSTMTVDAHSAGLSAGTSTSRVVGSSPRASRFMPGER